MWLKREHKSTKKDKTDKWTEANEMFVPSGSDTCVFTLNLFGSVKTPSSISQINEVCLV